MAAVRLSFTWFGVRKSLTNEQKAVAAESFGAAGDFLSAGKKLLDNRHPAYRAVTTLRSQTVSWWKGCTLPFPEPGIRLIRQDRIENFDSEMKRLKDKLDRAVINLDDHFSELKAAAQQRLGRLYHAQDYPESLRGLFAVAWDFPSVEPPDYLQDVHPGLFEQERARAAARFEEAVQLAEQAFFEEFRKVVGHLCERLEGVDGERKVFRDSAVDNLHDFFERFKELNVRSNEDLDALVRQAQDVVRGIVPQDLRDRDALRWSVAEEMSSVRKALDSMMVDRPRRRILRTPQPAVAAS
jgi:hypothetical protein